MNYQIISITGGADTIYFRDQKISIDELGPQLDPRDKEGRSIIIKADRYTPYETGDSGGQCRSGARRHFGRARHHSAKMNASAVAPLVFSWDRAAQTPPRLNRVPDSLRRLARALFLYLSNCLSAHRRAAAAAGAGNTDFAG